MSFAQELQVGNENKRLTTLPMTTLKIGDVPCQEYIWRKYEQKYSEFYSSSSLMQLVK